MTTVGGTEVGLPTKIFMITKPTQEKLSKA